MPNFDDKNPELWLEMVEARLSGTGIEEKDFYRKVRIDMPKAIAKKKPALLKPVEANDNWEYFKKEVKGLFSKSRVEELDELLGKMSIEDKNPMELMDEMIKLAGTDISAKVICMRFLQHFDDATLGTVRAVNWDQQATDEKGLRFMAEGLHRMKAKMLSSPKKASGSGAQIAAVSYQPKATKAQSNSNAGSSSSSDQKLDKILSRLSNLENRMSNLEQNARPNSQQKPQRPMQSAQNSQNVQNRSRANDRGNAAGNQKRGGSRNRAPVGDLCWYHAKFGAASTKCIQPCSWKGPLASASADSSSQPKN